jgi:hypothetical protein
MPLELDGDIVVERVSARVEVRSGNADLLDVCAEGPDRLFSCHWLGREATADASSMSVTSPAARTIFVQAEGP